MKTITVAELRQNPTAALNDVEDGEVYLVTRHRRPIARLAPVENEPIEIIPARNPGGVRLSDLSDWPRKSREEISALLADLEEDR